MSEKQLIRQIKELPSEAKQEAADFINFLYKKYFHKKKEATIPKKSILNSSFRGMWENRDDLSDSTKWVREIRESPYAS